jgi:transposase
MTIGAELRAEILRRYHTDRWRVGTIARQLRVHHSTVTRVLGAGTLGHKQSAPRRVNAVDPYLSYVLETLAKYPTLTASRLYVMVRDLGYPGGPSRFRQIVARHRPRPPSEAFLRLRTLPGEQGQCDWASFGHWQIGRARRALSAFMMVLSYSRRIYLHFFLNARMDSFLRGHAQAFGAWGGIPRVILTDFVTGHKIGLMCPSPLCGRLGSTLNYGRRCSG